MARKRPGKREREAAKRAAIEATVRETVRANMKAAKPPKAVPFGPRGLGNSTLARDTLKRNCHDMGFVGPRGFKTPRDIVPALRKGEVRVGGLAGKRTQAERERAQTLANLVRGHERPVQK